MLKALAVMTRDENTKTVVEMIHDTLDFVVNQKEILWLMPLREMVMTH